MSQFNVGDAMNEQDERDYYRATELEMCPVCAGPTEAVAGGPCDACWDMAPRSEEGA